MKRIIAIALLTAGCSKAPLAPTEAPKPAVQLEMAYTINVPALGDLQAYRAQFPSGIHLSPVAAQDRWNYTGTYGNPNVYFGPTAPRCQQYFNTGIVVAPYGAASKDQFTAADWPGIGLEPGVTYTWIGRFEFAQPALPSQYTETCR